jgi:hypothetical protein
MWTKILGLGLAATFGLITSGCFLKFTIATRTVETLAEEINLIIDGLFADATLGVCRTNGFGVTNCTYVVDGMEIGTSARFLAEFGLFGVVVDPLVLEVPAGAAVAGTFTGGGMSGDLVVYPAMSYVPIDDFQTLTPAPGKQLVIVDLPANAPVDGVDYSFALSLRRLSAPTTAPTEIKALLTGRVRFAGKTFYPPMFPCVSSFAAAPVIRLANSSTPQPVTFLGSASPCAEQVYRYFRSSRTCDLDNDHDVDVADINLIMNVRNTPAAAGDPRDTNQDAIINANDARFCTLQCTRSRCAE